jgi:hypothetical protein
MREYLNRILDTEGVSAETLLLPLAYAESPGLPVPLWRVAVKALDTGDVPEVSLRRFARLPAASYLLESAGGDGEGAAFRLFHQALNDALLRERSEVAEPRDDERALTKTFLAIDGTTPPGHRGRGPQRPDLGPCEGDVRPGRTDPGSGSIGRLRGRVAIRGHDHRSTDHAAGHRVLAPFASITRTHPVRRAGLALAWYRSPAAHASSLSYCSPV